MVEERRDLPTLPLKAYLASALTGLSTTERPLVDQVSALVVSVCAKFDVAVYEPQQDSDPIKHPDVVDTVVFQQDRSHLLNSDLLILLAHYTSFGAGEELAFAFGALLPIIIISPNKTRLSRMVSGTPAKKLLIVYEEIEDLQQALTQGLVEMRPSLEKRKLAFAKYKSNTVADKIRLLRENLKLTREQVAQQSQFLTVDALRLIEESPDHISNLTLIQLRQIAAVLDTTVVKLLGDA